MRIEVHEEAMKQFKEMLAGAMGDVTDRGFQVSQERCPEDKAFLIESGFTEIDEENMIFYFGYTAPYAPPVEWGSRPHWAPPVPIYEWVRRQLQKSGKKRNQTQEDVEYLFGIAFGRIKKRLSEAEKAFKAIYIDIGVNGTDEHPFMRPGLEVMLAEGPGILRSKLT